ncbi:hypothetical protein IH785_19290 [candidate division KSB1 bacterium]|nr:hypothetical protein [candidate division KSB1 bacterium]
MCSPPCVRVHAALCGKRSTGYLPGMRLPQGRWGKGGGRPPVPDCSKL